MNIKIFKKGQSQVISTILLILLVLVAVTLIISFVIPFVNERLKSGGCLDVTGKVELSNGYTCYRDSDNVMQVQVGIKGEINSIIDGFAIELGGGGSSNVVKIIKSAALSASSMCGAGFEIPPDNTERTYLINSVNPIPTFVKVSAILNDGEICPAPDSFNTISNCILTGFSGENVCTP